MTDNTVTGAAAAQEKREGINTLVLASQQEFATVLPTHMRDRSDTFVRMVRAQLTRNPKLHEVATRNPPSLLRAALDCAELGLRPGVTYHLVPFGDEVQGIIDYTGKIELMYRAGAAASVRAHIVRENDEFEYTPDMDRPRHKYPPFASAADRGEMIGAYAYAVMKDGATSQVAMMNREEIEKVRDNSPMWRNASEKKRRQSPWTIWEDRMWKKSVVHQLEKYVPTSPEYLTAQLAAVARAHDRITGVEAPPVVAAEPYLDGEIVGEGSAAEEAAQAAEGQPGHGDPVGPEDNPGFGGDGR